MKFSGESVMSRFSISATLGVLGFCLASMAIAAQDAPKQAADHGVKNAAQTSVTPRTPDGTPDLSGIWNASGGPPLIIRKDDQGRTTKLLFAEPDADFSKGDAANRARRAAAPNQPPYRPELLE